MALSHALGARVQSALSCGKNPASELQTQDIMLFFSGPLGHIALSYAPLLLVTRLAQHKNSCARGFNAGNSFVYRRRSSSMWSHGIKPCSRRSRPARLVLRQKSCVSVQRREYLRYRRHYRRCGHIALSYAPVALAKSALPRGHNPAPGLRRRENSSFRCRPESS